MVQQFRRSAGIPKRAAVKKPAGVPAKNPFATPNRNMANRGKGLETLLDYTNRQYKNTKLADVRKVPTPVQITGTNKNGTITGRKLKGEWVDYVGVGQGRAIAYDAKETKAKSLPLQNLEDTQFEFLESWYQQGACTFLIVAFTNKIDEIYMLPFPILQRYWDAAQVGGRKSIPYDEFFNNGTLIVSGRGYALDYLAALEKGCFA